MRNEFVSIITPSYNSANFISDAIDSALRQTYKNWELIIADDKSTDNSIEIIEKYDDDRIKLVKLKENGGAAKARNAAIDLAQGRFIAFLDSDDIWHDNFLETTVNYLIQNKKELVFTSYLRVDEELNPYIEPFIVPEQVDYQRLLYNCPIFITTSVYDTKRVGKIKMPIVEKREDYAFFLNLLKEIPVAYGLNKTLVTYRIRKGSYSRNKWEIAKYQFLTYYKFLKLPLYKSAYFTICWALNGLRKYGSI